VDIQIIDQQQDLSISAEQAQAIVHHVLSSEGKRCDEVAIHFVDNKRISELHQQFFDRSYPTDCISFPIDSPEEKGDNGYCILGDVFICPKVALDYAQEHHADPYHEATLYLVHGLLHLLGYDDVGDMEPAMREAEERHIKQLSQKNLLLKANH